jgi:hypothetical protein
MKTLRVHYITYQTEMCRQLEEKSEEISHNSPERLKNGKYNRE